MDLPVQIRLGTRQDEDTIHSLCSDVMHEFGLDFDLEQADVDLRNIESNYFAHDGLFLIAERNGEIVGFAAARKAAWGDDLELVRFVVERSWRGKQIGHELLTTIVSYAREMDYSRIVVEPVRQYPGGQQALMSMGFTSEACEDAQQAWYLSLAD